MLTKLLDAPGFYGVVLLGLLLGGCGSNSTEATTESATTEPPPVASSALRATSDAELTAYFRAALGPDVNNPLKTEAEVLFMAMPATTTAVTSNLVMSGTVLQETGVDEADLIKSDGTYVYSMDPDSTSTGPYFRNTLRRQRLDGATSDSPLVPVDSLKIPFSTNVGGSGFYLDEDRQQLAVLGEGNQGQRVYDLWFSPRSWGQGLTEVILVDTADPLRMQTRRTLQMTGHLIGSRRLGATLYLVLRTYPEIPGLDPWWPTDKKAANQELIDNLQASQVLPKLTVDGGAAQPLVQASECYVQNQNSDKSGDIITVVAIDLAATTHSHAARCFTGGTEAFYLSEQSLFLATTQTAYTYSGTSPVYAPTTSTDIHKFALNGKSITYRGSGSVAGHLGFDQNRKSFRMGEYASALRVITQTEPTRRGWVTIAALPTMTAAANATVDLTPPILDSPGHLSILQEKAGALQTVGELPNAARPQPLGKAGEQLYATRFLGTRGYLVTYRLTDPLYVLDLSDPTDPVVAGELQVDGYSDYLFPLNENLLLGVGKDAKSDGTAGDGRFAWYQGVKVSLIDVTDPAAPREAARAVIGKRGTDATVLHDHHGIAFQTKGNTVRISLPVSIHETPNPYSNSGLPSNYFDFTRTELQRFEVDLAARSLVSRPAMVSPPPPVDRAIINDRSLLWNEQVHWYQDGSWNSGAW